jgi:hypothetical protein
MARSNCLLFAVALYLRRARRGDAGYIVMRRSRFGRFPHFLYLHHQRRLISFCPTNPKHKLLPPPLFRGSVKWGDR